jgi:hypothetical protein
MRNLSVVLAVVNSTLTLAAPALAEPRVAYVSATGVNSATCGTAAAPCQTFQYALDNIVAPGGVILIKGGAIASGGIEIKKSVSIIADSAATAVFHPSGAVNGIYIDAGASGAVTLKGLSITSANPGGSGIFVNSAAEVDIIDCVVQGFAGDGIAIKSNTPLQYSISRTSVLDNGGNGIYVNPQAGGSAKGSIAENEVLRNRGGYGGVTIDGSNGAASAYIQNTRSSFNVGIGFAKVTGGTFRLASSTATGNANNVGSYGGGGPGYSYQNNFLIGNTSDSGTGYLTNISPQ